MAGSNPETAGNTSHPGGGRIFLLHTQSQLFVSQWTLSGVYGLTAAMLTAILLSVTYECLSEYLRFLRNRALMRKTRPQCCGVPVVSFGEKLLQTIVHLLRVLIGYLLMVCVMTMNVWLIIAVVVGAVVGYGVGKPLVANCIHDIISSHDYKRASVDMSYGKKNTSQRSMSWRYRPNEMIDMDPARLREEIELLTKEAEESHHDEVFGNVGVDSNAEVVWIRRSALELDKVGKDENLDADDVELRHSSGRTNLVTPKTDHFDTLDSVKTNDSLSSRTSIHSRFKSTSKVINDSFRSTNSDNYRQSLSRQSAFHSLDRPDSRLNSSQHSPVNSPGRANRRTGVGRSASTASYTSDSLSLNRSSSKVSGRFKPISKQISKEITNLT